MLSVITQPLHNLKLHIVNYVDKNKHASEQTDRQTDRQRDTIEQIPKTKHRYVTPMTEKRMNSRESVKIGINIDYYSSTLMSTATFNIY